MDWILGALTDSQIDAWLGICGSVLLVLGLTSGLINNRWSISEPLIALTVGVLVGPIALNWVSLDGEAQTTQFLHLAARLTLAIALVDAAMTLPTLHLINHWRPLAVMLVVVMPCMWLLTSAIAYLSLGVGLMTAILLGGALTPTDPVLASAIVHSRIAEKTIPDRLRWLVTAESGANDALALPMVLLPIVLTDETVQRPWLHWAFWGVFWELVVSIGIGAIAGWVSARMLRWAASSRDADRTSLLTVVLSLALALLGAIHLMDSDGLLAVFVSGLVLNHFIRDEEESRHERLHEAIRRFFELPVFVILGAGLP